MSLCLSLLAVQWHLLLFTFLKNEAHHLLQRYSQSKSHPLLFDSNIIEERAVYVMLK